MQEPLTDVLKQGSQGSELSLAENAGCRAADGIDKRSILDPISTMEMNIRIMKP